MLTARKRYQNDLDQRLVELEKAERIDEKRGVINLERSREIIDVRRKIIENMRRLGERLSDPFG
jgi:hypothetical protein